MKQVEQFKDHMFLAAELNHSGQSRNNLMSDLCTALNKWTDFLNKHRSYKSRSSDPGILVVTSTATSLPGQNSPAKSCARDDVKNWSYVHCVVVLLIENAGLPKRVF